MGFNELNSVEHYIIHKLSGENLNPSHVHATAELLTQPHTYINGWSYKSTEDLGRSVKDVIIDSELSEAMIRLNPEITAKPELAEQVIYNLNKILNDMRLID